MPLVDNENDSVRKNLEEIKNLRIHYQLFGGSMRIQWSQVARCESILQVIYCITALCSVSTVLVI